MTGVQTCALPIYEQDIVYRNTAKENQLICVSGDLGAAYMGLQLLEREKLVFQGDENAQPDFAGYEYILERQLKPEARKDIVQQFKEKNILPTAMIDISDGLASEIMHICKDSGIGCNIYEEKIPIDYQTFKMAEELNMNATVCALSGGEDYELLQPVYSLNLVNDIFEPELEGYYHNYRIVHVEHSDRIIEGLHFVFVELPKFTPHTNKENKMHVLWLRYLTEIDEKTREVPPELLDNPDIKKAVAQLEESAFTDAQLRG